MIVIKGFNCNNNTNYNDYGRVIHFFFFCTGYHDSKFILHNVLYRVMMMVRLLLFIGNVRFVITLIIIM